MKRECSGMLTGNDLQLLRSVRGELEAIYLGRPVGPVTLIRTFPVSQLETCISVRLANGDELALLPSLEALDDVSRREARLDLKRRYLIPGITRITAVSRRGTGWQWKVETDYGPVSFRTRQPYEHIESLAKDTYVISDLEGRKYTLRSIREMDAHSRAVWNRIY